MDFTGLSTERLLRLQISGDGTTLAYIDGRGAGPHYLILPNETGLPKLASLNGTSQVEIVDNNGSKYCEGIKPADIKVDDIRRSIRESELGLCMTYQDYRATEELMRKRPLPQPRD